MIIYLFDEPTIFLNLGLIHPIHRYSSTEYVLIIIHILVLVFLHLLKYILLLCNVLLEYRNLLIEHVCYIIF